MAKIRVLVVDDSVVMRRLITEVLQTDERIEVVATAPNGRIALQKLTQVNPDVVTMDVEMPELDGVSTVRELRKTFPKIPVIMFSTLTQRGASATLDALAAGATDYVTKPSGVGSLSESFSLLKEELLPRIRVHFQRAVPPPPPLTPKPSLQSRFSLGGRPGPTPTRGGLSSTSTGKLELLCIGTSTGGPMALERVFAGFTQPIPVPIVVVQHMPAMFTQMLAQRLSSLPTTVRCVEAAHAMPLKPGHAYVAPGGFHLTVHRDSAGAFTARINSDPPENSCRPAVDVLFRSAASLACPSLGVILTGMGQDGMRGCELLREQGGHIIAQDQASSVVWGMPGSVVQAGLAHTVLPLDQISAEIQRRLR